MEKIKSYAMNIDEGLRVEKAQSCLLCKSKGELLYRYQRDRLFSAPGTWSLMSCPKCGLVWLNPRPIPGDMGKLYETYPTHKMNDYTPKLARLRKIIRNTILATHMGYNGLADGLILKMLGRILSFVGPIREIVELGVMGLRCRERGNLLDVGCGSGAFLAKLSNLGWEVAGVEPDGEAVKVARERFGIKVYRGMLEEVAYPSDKFDVITMNHVIEHVYDPIALLTECHRILKPDGNLVVITPNIESLGHRLFGEAWRGLEVPRHLNLFSSRSLKTCADRAGFKEMTLPTTARKARGIWGASRLIRRNGILPGSSPTKLGWRLQLEGLIFQVIEYGLCRLKKAGEELLLIARKAEAKG